MRKAKASENDNAANKVNQYDEIEDKEKLLEIKKQKTYQTEVVSKFSIFSLTTERQLNKARNTVIDSKVILLNTCKLLAVNYSDEAPDLTTVPYEEVYILFF